MLVKSQYCAGQIQSPINTLRIVVPPLSLANQMDELSAVMMFLILPLLMFCSFVRGAVGGVAQNYSADMLMQPAGMKSLEHSAILRRLLLVVTLDGTLAAYDKYSGAFYWENTELIQGRALLDGKYPENLKGAPIYMFEPVGPAAMFAYLPGGGIQVRKATVFPSIPNFLLLFCVSIEIASDY